MLIAKKNSSKIISALLCLTLCITCFCAIPVYADEPVNLLLGKIATCTAGRATGTLSNLTDGKYNYRADGDVTCTYAHVTYGAYNSDTLAAHSAYFEYSFDDATRLNDVKLYVCSVETNQWARDVAIDVQLEDGTWQRVAADYNIKYGPSNVGGTYYEDSPVTQIYMEYKFAPVDCVKLRITSNRKRMRINKGLTGNTCVFRLAEIQAFYDPGITTYSAVERPDQADYAVPIELVNYAACGAVTTKSSNSNSIDNLTDGDKTNRAFSYYYQGTTTPTDDQCLNYYDIAFGNARVIDRVDVIYSRFADDDRGHREQDIAIDAITADGGYLRVAEKHNFAAPSEAPNGSNYTLSLTFDAIEAIGVRISANCKQTARYTEGTYSNIFQCYAEVEAYNDPNVISNTGIEAATVSGTEIPHVHIAGAEWDNDENDHWKVCTECDEQFDKAAHTFDDGVVTDPTCTEGGYTTYTCTVCGYSYQDNETTALGHNFVDYVSDNNATCTSDGTKTAKCTRCEVTDTIADAGSMLAHNAGEWITDANGHHRHCADCDQDVDAGEHTYEWVITKEATAEENGLREEICSVCGYKSGNSEDIIYSQHKPGDINGDGSLNNKDLTRLFQYLSDWDVEVNESALDVNGDGSVNNKDLTRLFQYLSDWDVSIF